MDRSKKVVRLGMDIGKNTFHLFGVDETGLPVVKKKLRGKQVLAWFEEPWLIGKILEQVQRREPLSDNVARVPPGANAREGG